MAGALAAATSKRALLFSHLQSPVHLEQPNPCGCVIVGMARFRPAHCSAACSALPPSHWCIAGFGCEQQHTPCILQMLILCLMHAAVLLTCCPLLSISACAPSNPSIALLSPSAATPPVLSAHSRASLPVMLCHSITQLPRVLLDSHSNVKGVTSVSYEHCEAYTACLCLTFRLCGSNTMYCALGSGCLGQLWSKCLA